MEGKSPASAYLFCTRAHIHEYISTHTLSLNYGLQFPKTDIGFKLTFLLSIFFFVGNFLPLFSKANKIDFLHLECSF